MDMEYNKVKLDTPKSALPKKADLADSIVLGFSHLIGNMRIGGRSFAVVR